MKAVTIEALSNEADPAKLIVRVWFYPESGADPTYVGKLFLPPIAIRMGIEYRPMIEELTRLVEPQGLRLHFAGAALPQAEESKTAAALGRTIRGLLGGALKMFG